MYQEIGEEPGINAFLVFVQMIDTLNCNKSSQRSMLLFSLLAKIGFPGNFTRNLDNNFLSEVCWF